MLEKLDYIIGVPYLTIRRPEAHRRCAKNLRQLPVVCKTLLHAFHAGWLVRSDVYALSHWAAAFKLSFDWPAGCAFEVRIKESFHPLLASHTPVTV